MCSENVTSLPYFSARSGLTGFSLAEITETHIGTAKLLPAWALSHCAGLPSGFPTLSVDQVIEGLHGQGGAWKLPGCFSGFSPLADDTFKNGIFHGNCNKLGQTTRSEAYAFPSNKKLANDRSFWSNRPSRDLINTLPDEMLCNIFQFLGSARDRVACGSVSKRWLMLQSHMPRERFLEEDDTNPGKVMQSEGGCVETDDEDGEDDQAEFVQQKEHWGDLSRCLSGRRASDVRLAAIALGTKSRGGLGKLCIRGQSAAGLEVSVTDVGISAIGSWCLGLRVLSLWCCPYVTDEGLSAIGKGCRMLERVDLFKCPLLGDAGLISVSKNCARLSYLNLDECEQVGDKSLMSISEHCPNVMTLTIQNCPCISDRGIVAAVSSLKRLKKMKLSGLRISDESLTSIGAQASALLWLTLHNLDLVSVYGFSFLSTKTSGLQSLKRLSISSCRNFTDISLVLLGKSCCSLKHISLFKCEQVTDEGLTLFMKCASLLQVIELEKCHAITGTGLVAALSGRVSKLKEVQVKKCEGIRNIQGFCLPCPPNGPGIESICLAECPGVGDLVLALIGMLCPEVKKLDLSGLTDITDDGVLMFLCGSCKLTTVKISGCVKVTDRAISAIARECGQSLRTLVLDGCKNVSDKSLMALASHSSFVEDLDVSECSISYEGLKLLVDASGESLSSLNLSGCIGITDRILPLIHKSCNSLLDLNVKNCPGLSERAIAGFKERMWNCTVLY